VKNYNRILQAVYATPWAIQPDKLEAILAFLELKASGGAIAPEVLQQIHLNALAVEAARKSAGSRPGSDGSVVVLPLLGLISHRMNLMSEISGPGGTSTERFGTEFRAALEDPKVSAIVLDVDSPGGTVDGVPELADLIMSARGKKPVTAVANTQMASAAYWIASAASELVASPSAMVGSIGVFAVHQDESKAMEQAGVKPTIISYGKYKTEGNRFGPLGDAARGALQAIVDDLGNMFTRTVAKARNVPVDDVRSGFGEGRVATAQQALKMGMVDRIATLDEVLGKYGIAPGAAGQARAETGIPEIQAKAPVTAEDHHRRVEYERRRLELV
jgi:signal peptide peptidase SppA